MKQHKTQILAALALAFCLGVVAPSAVFADGGAEGTAAQAADVASAVTGADLFALVTTAKSDANFTKYQNLVTAQANLAKDLANASSDVLTAARNAVTALEPTAQVASLNATDLNDYIIKMDAYKKWSGIIGALNGIVKDTGVANIGALTLANMASLNDAQISKNYDALYAALYPVSKSYAENILQLNSRITTRNSFAAYRAAVPMIQAAEALKPYNQNAKDYLLGIPPMSDTSVWDALSATSQALVENMRGFEALTAIKGTADYAGPVKTAVDAALATMDTNVAALKAQLSGVEGVNNMHVDQLIVEAEKTPNYAKFADLYNTLGVIRDAGTTAAALDAKYTQATLASSYSKMLAAAEAIDPSAGRGLLTMPTTSAPDDGKKPGNSDDNKSDVDAPNTGIIGLFESGALDMGTLTLIVSVAVAGLAGIGIIAKLYLKHKF